MRNITGLTQEQIEHIQVMWEFITQSAEGSEGRETYLDDKIMQGLDIKIDISKAHENYSTTAFIELTNTVRIGADVYPATGSSISANDTMSPFACLCHEYAHAVRYHLGFRRPFNGALMHLDEAETSIHASYEPALYPSDRITLIDDASERLAKWRIE